MAGKWDSNLKRLVDANPQEFVGWLVEGAIVTRELSVEVNREIYIDMLYEVTRKGRLELVHIEFQRYEDKEMAWRTVEYNVFATCKYKCPVHSFVIYLRKEGPIVEPPFIMPETRDPEIWRFHFTNVKLWEVPTERLRQLQSFGVLPLFALTREGGNRSVVEEVISGLEQAQIERKEKNNLLTIAFHLFTLSMEKPVDQDWLRRKFYMLRDIIHDTEFYQIILQEGREEGLEKGLEEGLEKGLEKGLRAGSDAFHQVIIATVERRFPELTGLATERVVAVSNLESLQKLTLDINAVASLDQARALLEALPKDQQSH